MRIEDRCVGTLEAATDDSLGIEGMRQTVLVRFGERLSGVAAIAERRLAAGRTTAFIITRTRKSLYVIR